MSAPDFTGDTASIASQFTVRPSDTMPPPPVDFGPDVNGSQPFENIDTGNAKKPANGREPRPGRSPLGSLGQNKKVRSPIRKLVDKDREKIANLYVLGGMALMPIRPQAAQLMAAAADQCAEAWYDLAQENDSIRRVLLALIEGGAWGKVFMAHMPILVALIPQHVLPPALRNSNIGQQLMDMMGMSVPDSPDETLPDGERP